MAIPAYQIIPNATDQLSQSQSDIQNNFSAIQGLVDVNHVDFSDGTNYGKHKWINFPVQTGLPNTQFAAGEVGLYNQLPTSNPLTGVNELWINKQNTSGAVQIPFSASTLSYIPAPGNSSNGWSYLPSGLLIKWGIIPNFTRDTAVGVTFPTASNIAVFNQLFAIQCTPFYSGTPSRNNLNVILNVSNLAPTGFTIYATTATSAGSSNINAYFFAIGY